MTNQDTDDPKVHAHLGLIRIPGGTCREEGQLWLEYTPEEASRLTVAISVAIRDARDQLRAIAEACANGHEWNAGINWTIATEKITLYRCTRAGCEGYDERPGWLPFEPKQHVVPFASKLLDCTGPGCERCDNDRLADSFSKFATDALHRLAPDLSALTAAVDTTPLLRGEPTPDRWASIAPKKLGYTWAIDATPGQVQAALDARQGGA